MLPEVILVLSSLSFLLPAATAVNITVDASAKLGPLPPINRFFGCDEPNFAYYPHGAALLSELGSLGPGPTYFRTHNLLTTGNGSATGVPALKWGSTSAYAEDAAGSPVYNWTVVDRIFDAYLARNVKPYAQVGFMPLALTRYPQTYFFDFTPDSPYDVIYTGWSSPPTSWEKWGELVYQWVTHCVERYGRPEVESWYWEVWNEPNIDYWNGTQAEFFALHDTAVAAIRRALPTARVGGCEVAGGRGGTFLADFLNHALAAATPLDFLSFHTKGAPAWINTTTPPSPPSASSALSPDPGFVRMNLSTQLAQTAAALSLIATYPPRIRHLPVILGEFDPDGCAACVSAPYRAYRVSALYAAYTAAALARLLDVAQREGVRVQGAVTWAFEYEDSALLRAEGVELGVFDGFRVLATRGGVGLPVLGAHRMVGMVVGGGERQRVEARSDGQVGLGEVLERGVRGEGTDVGVLASVDDAGGRVFVLVWHYHDDDRAFPERPVRVEVSGLAVGERARVTHWRVDDEHGNAFTVWQRMGAPEEPSDEQYEQLAEAGKLAMLEPPKTVDVQGNATVLDFSMPIRSVSLVVLEAA